ncbi:MAG: hypothetical protein IPM29_10575, partial [Planctomycetes bacterium]|nr:hypothetical protein [Planctomycetota bacterium]
PFRTIAAAVHYVNDIPARAGLPAGTPPLPYTSTSPNGLGHVWTHAIIHLLPGVYSPSDEPHGDILLDGNGDTFPIVIPPHVSIQGTSILDTVIAAGHQPDPGPNQLNPAEWCTPFVFGVFYDPSTGQVVPAGHANAVAASGEGCFIANLTFYGCGVNPFPQGRTLADQRWQGAILLDDATPATPVVTNCVFVKNRVGILINAEGPMPGDEPTHHDGFASINNTFVWNGIGIWNGYGATIDHSSTVAGVSELILINNVFDSSEPGLFGDHPVFCDYFNGTNARPATWPFGGGDSNFEGVAQADMRVDIGSGVFIDFNAYERGTRSGLTPIQESNYNKGHNGGGYTRVSLPRPLLRSGASMPIPAATRNIAEITGYQSSDGAVVPPPFSGSKPRGVLYVCDLFCLGRYDQGIPAGDPNAWDGFPPFPEFEGSPLDFRIAPTATEYPDDYSGAPFFNCRNPLVDNGLDLATSAPVTLENGQIATVPGLAHQVYPLDAWSVDGEGFGNPRVHDHPHALYSDTTLAVDIGADELGDLLVAGYHMGKSSFVRLRSSHPENPRSREIQNHFMWYFSVANTGSAQMQSGHRTRGFTQPYYRTLVTMGGIDSDWPAAYSFAPGAGPYTWHSTELLTLPPMWQRPWRFQHFPVPNPPVSFAGMYLATAADVTPHLLPDVHPWWTMSGLAAGLPNQTPPSLMFWQSCAAMPAGAYNGSLYLPVTSPVINPPGVYDGYVDVPRDLDFAWLDGLNWGPFVPSPLPAPSFETFARWENYLSPKQLNDVDGWCRLYDAARIGPLRVYELPSTLVRTSNATHPIAIRFSLECNTVGMLSEDKNIQSFMVLIDDPESP